MNKIVLVLLGVCVFVALTEARSVSNNEEELEEDLKRVLEDIENETRGRGKGKGKGRWRPKPSGPPPSRPPRPSGPPPSRPPRPSGPPPSRGPRPSGPPPSRPPRPSGPPPSGMPNPPPSQGPPVSKKSLEKLIDLLEKQLKGQ